MLIRQYQPGDESAQVRIYNTTAAGLPAFKPASCDEVERRYRSVDPDPAAKFYAVEDGEVVGYAVFNPNGRISFPWCLPGYQALREPLLEAVLEALRRRGQDQAWAAYRADWEPVLAFFHDHRFEQSRSMINFIAELARLPHEPVPEGRVLRPLNRGDWPRVVELGRDLFAGDDGGTLEGFYRDNPFFDASSLIALESAAGDASLLGAAVIIGAASYADPARIDAAMPCFRLGAMGTERERHKRVNGLFSCVLADEPAGVTLLSEAARRLERAGLTHLAAQAPSDQPALVAFYDRHLRRQGSFPIVARRLSP